MLRHPLAILAVLLLIEAGVLLVARHWLGRKLFAVLPTLFWIYFLPTVAASFGILPNKSPLYPALVQYLLPASLLLLFISVDLPSTFRLGPMALGSMSAGILGILLGGPLVLLLLGSWLPVDAWAGLGALGGSWMGGSANMVAVKASIGTPEHLFAQAVVVDVVVAYSWMALLVALANHQDRFDVWNKVRASSLQKIAQALQHRPPSVSPAALPNKPIWLRLPRLCILAALAATGSALSHYLGDLLPVLEGIISAYTWTVLWVTALGIALSFTPLCKLESWGASNLGYWALYLVLAAIGAQADLAALSRAPLLVLAGALWMIFHGAMLLLFGRLLRVPLFLLATASQACVGGPVSAPLVAATYRPGLAGVGLLLAVLGNVCGTYLGILCGILCRAVAG